MKPLRQFREVILRRQVSRSTLGLALLAVWASLLSFEVLFRLPGAILSPGLPHALERSGLLHRRQQGQGSVAPLPPDVVLVESADYVAPEQGRRGRSIVRLRRLLLNSSGTGVVLPVEALGNALIGPGAQGACVRLDDRGMVVRRAANNSQWQTMVAESRPTGPAMGLWLLGLRPYRDNLCVWEEDPSFAGPRAGGGRPHLGRGPAATSQ